MHLEKSGANVRVTKFCSLKSSEKGTKKIYETGDAIEVEERREREREFRTAHIKHANFKMDYT